MSVFLACWAFAAVPTSAHSQPSVIDLSVTGVASGYSHTCALSTAGGLKCWGDNTYGQLGDGTTVNRAEPVQVVGLQTGVVGVVAGYAHSCALTTAGAVKCWGRNIFGELGDETTTDRASPVDVSELGGSVAMIAVGTSHTCALTSGGGVKCWGGNYLGTLGDGTTTDRQKPVSVLGLTSGVLGVSAGASHTCAVTSAGEVKCWGSNTFGQLGDGTTTSRLTPVAVSGLASGVVSLSAGSTHNCVLKSGGGLQCWGSNSGQLGDGTTTARHIPVDVTGLTSGVASVTSGETHTCAVTNAGAVKCWGQNAYGGLGDGTTDERTSAVAVSGLASGVARVSAGGNHSCAVATTGGLRCWGRNVEGQLGVGTTTNALSPLDVAGFASGVAALSTGGYHTCGLTPAGGVKCWGLNGSGQLGDGTTSHRFSPTQASGLSSGVQKVSAGGSHTCAVTREGGAKCWGENAHGQLGDGTTTKRSTAVDVLGLTSGVADIEAGPENTCAVTTGGALKCWGANPQGQLGDGTTTESKTPIDVSTLSSGIRAVVPGDLQTCALSTTGGMKCWGYNSSGGLGDGTTTQRLTPVDVSGYSTDVISMGVGQAHACAVTSTGGAACWGHNGNGQLGDGSTSARATPGDVSGLTTGMAQISAGYNRTCAVTTGGAVKCWGYNGTGALGDGTTTQRLTPVDVVGLADIKAVFARGSGAHTCALTSAGGARCWGANYYGALGDGTDTTRLTAVVILSAQTLSFSPPATVSLGSVTTLSATASSGLAVVFDTWTPATCSVSGSSLTTAATGFCGIRASQPGNANVAAAAQSATLISVTPVPPTLSGATSGSVTANSARLGGTVASDGGAAISGRGVVYAIAAVNNDPLIGGTGVTRATTSGTTGAFTLDVIGLEPSTPYAFKAYATNAMGTAYTAVGTFSTPALPPTQMAVNTGDNQSATVGSAVQTPVSVIVRNASHAPVASVSVTFAVGAGGGSLTGAEQTTNALGVATLGSWTLGPAAGSLNNTLSATSSSLPGSLVTFVASGVAAPVISIGSVAAAEGDTGTKTFTFAATLSPAGASTATVNYASQDGTASAGSDYVSTSGTLTFSPGETSKSIVVTVNGDTTSESNEAFGVRLSAPSLSTLGRALGQGAILNDDPTSETPRSQPSWQEFFAVDPLETPYAGDFNGDRRTDIITFTRQNPNAIGDVYVALSDGVTFGANTKWHDWFAISSNESVVIGDYNGDGRDDVATWLATSSRQVYVALSTGTGMMPETAWVSSIGTDPTDILYSGDANGDGKDDLFAFARKEGKVYIALSDGAKFGTPSVWHVFFAVSTYERPRVADVNGDGKSDIVTFATDSPTAFGDVYVATSNGAQFVSLEGVPNDSSKWHDFFAIRPSEEIRIGDLNGDGRDDFFTFLPPPFAQCYSVLSQGTSMSGNVLWAEEVAPLLGVGDTVYAGDVNGDLKADIIIFAQKEGKVFVSLAR